MISQQLKEDAAAEAGADGESDSKDDSDGNNPDEPNPLGPTAYTTSRVQPPHSQKLIHTCIPLADLFIYKQDRPLEFYWKGGIKILQTQTAAYNPVFTRNGSNS